MQPSYRLEDLLEKIQQTHSRLNAVITTTEHHAHQLLQNEPQGPLSRVPFTVKDVIDVEGYPTGMGSNVELSAIAPRSAEVVQRLESAGAITVAKTNLHEFSYGITGAGSAHGRGIHPLGPEWLTGGSSFGSALTVTAGIVPLAVGTDTAGSVRVPAGILGTNGFKPSPGIIPDDGIFPLSPSFDTVGFFGADIRIIGAAFGVFKPQNADYPDHLAATVVDGQALNPEITAWINRGVSSVLEAPPQLLQLFTLARRVYEPIRSYEAFQIHRDFLRAQSHNYQPATLEKLRAGAKISRLIYDAAQDKLQQLREELGKLWSGYEMVITPAVRGPVRRHWSTMNAQTAADLMHYSVVANVLGLPAITLQVPVAEDKQVPVQIMGPPGADWLVLTAARHMVEEESLASEEA